jgi:hypothetical protein
MHALKKRLKKRQRRSTTAALLRTPLWWTTLRISMIAFPTVRLLSTLLSCLKSGCANGQLPKASFNRLKSPVMHSFQSLWISVDMIFYPFVGFSRLDARK